MGRCRVLFARTTNTIKYMFDRNLQNKILMNSSLCSPVDAGPSDEVESSVGESSSISDELIDQPLSVAVKDRVKLLSLQAPKVLRGLRDLVGITNVPGGKYEVFKAGAIPKAVELTGTMECTNRAVSTTGILFIYLFIPV